MSQQNQPYLDLVANAFRAKEAWRMATFVVSAVAIMLAFALVQNTKNTPVVLVPQDFSSESGRMTVTTNGSIKGSSAEYVANVALGDLSLILNYTPDNVINQHRRFLNRVTEALYAQQKDALVASADVLRKDGITQSFNPTDVRVSVNGDQVTVTGTQIRYRAGTELQRATVTYIISYKVYKGFLHVSDLRQK